MTHRKILTRGALLETAGCSFEYGDVLVDDLRGKPETVRKVPYEYVAVVTVLRGILKGPREVWQHPSSKRLVII